MWNNKTIAYSTYKKKEDVKKEELLEDKIKRTENDINKTEEDK